jgi:hypothetical protein
LSVEQDDPPPHELDVVLDGEDPVLESLAVPAMVRQRQPLPVSVDIVDMSGPAKAIVGVIKRRADAVQEEQATVRDQFVPTAIGDRWPVAVSLDSAKLEPGDYFVKVLVSDRVGKQSEAVTPITIGMPLPSGEDMPRELRGTVRGTVRFGPRFKPDRITVRLVGSDREPALTANGGRFQFDNVPAGSYTLEARGPVRGYIKQGRTEVELKTKEDFERQITIDLTEAGD